MKYATDRPFADPEKAARKLLEIASETEAVQDGRIHIEKINGPFLYKENGSPAEYGIHRSIQRYFPLRRCLGFGLKCPPDGADPAPVLSGQFRYRLSGRIEVRDLALLAGI